MNPNCHVMSVYYLSDSPIKWIYLHCLPNEKYIANYMGRIWKLETLRTDTKQTKIKTHTHTHSSNSEGERREDQRHTNMMQMINMKRVI